VGVTCGDDLGLGPNSILVVGDHKDKDTVYSVPLNRAFYGQLLVLSVRYGHSRYHIYPYPSASYAWNSPNDPKQQKLHSVRTGSLSYTVGCKNVRMDIHIFFDVLGSLRLSLASSNLDLP